MNKFAPLIEIETPKTYEQFVKLIAINNFLMAPDAQVHVYHLSETAEQFLPTYYKEKGLRVMYDEEARRLYVEKMESK